MRPAARVQAVAEILDGLDWYAPVEPQLKAWERGNRYAGSKDRRAIADHVYACLRRRGTLAARMEAAGGRALALAGLVDGFGLSPEAVAAICDGQRYSPAPLTEAERGALRAPPADPALDWPEFLRDGAREAFGGDAALEFAAMQQRAPLDLRVNTLLTDREAARRLLAEDGILAAPHPLSPTALRMTEGRAVLQSRAYKTGWVEPQDAASQAVADFAAVEPGMRVLDACAGGGGKTLALAASLGGQGRVVAFDVDPRRMAGLPDRARRAGAGVEIVHDLDALDAPFDCVLVDAPCSGSGSWRRDPMGKWRLTPERFAELRQAQREALASAAAHVAPGGTLVYATCSVLPSENEDRVAAFLSSDVGFAETGRMRLHPARDGGDGFFAARLTKG